MTTPPPPLTAIVFSKDRALQLDGLLRSVHDHWTIPLKDIVVIYRQSSDVHLDAYRRAQYAANDRGQQVRWVDEGWLGGFRQCLENVVASMSQEENVVWWTDDDLVYRPLVLGPETYAAFDPERHLFLSTRLDRKFKLAHADHVPESHRVPPEFTNPGDVVPLEWEWKKAPCTPWNYSFSVEGTVYNAGLLQRMHQETRYVAPNTYECEGANWCNHAPGVPALALSVPRACTFGNNINITQTEWLTPVGKVWSMDRLAELFDKGTRLNNEWFYARAGDITDCHHIIEDEDIVTTTP